MSVRFSATLCRQKATLAVCLAIAYISAAAKRAASLLEILTLNLHMAYSEMTMLNYRRRKLRD
jgi:hypothetical protein